MKRKTLQLLPVFMSFFVMGFVDVVGISTSYVKNDFNLTNTMANLLPMMVFVWFAVFSIPVGILQSRIGKRKMLTIGILMTMFAMLIPVFFYSYALVLLTFVLIGISNTIIQVSANPLLHDVSSKENFSSNMSLSQFVKSIASLVAPIAVSFFASRYGDWKLIFYAYAITSLFSMLWLMFTRIDEAQEENKQASFKSCLSLLKDRYILLFAIAILAIVGIDVGINSNIALVLTNKFNITTEQASIAIQCYFYSLIAARFLGAMFLKKLNPKKFLMYSVLFSFFGFFGVFVSQTLVVACVSVIVIGLGTANVFPLIFSAAVEKMPNRANEISGLMIMSVCGGAVFPFFMGVVADSMGSLNRMFVLVACAIYIAAISVLINKKTSKRVNK